MSITDELREWANANLVYLDSMKFNLLAIANRIDAENERECHEQYVCGAEHGIGASIEASMIQDRGYIELPKDADGKVIRIGDVLDNTHKDWFAAKAVIGISYHPGGKTCVEVDENRLRWHDPSKLRHHRTTVEDVLASYGSAAIELHHEHKNGEMGFEEYHAAMDGLAAMYAAKLRLAESEDE